MLVDICVHSVSAALHYQLGSGSPATVHLTQARLSLSVHDSASGHMTVEA